MNVNKIFKRMLFIMLSVLLCFTSAGCSIGEKGSDKLQIVTTLFPQYDFAKQITGDNAQVTLLLKPGAESHSYEPTPQDIAKIQSADVFLYIGGESEVWVEEILGSVSNDKQKVLCLMDYITPIEVGHTHEHEEEHHEGENEHNYDEHIFTSLKNSQILLDEICNVICEADKANEKLYKENASDYSAKLSELDSKFTDMIAASARKTVVFGDRFPFTYFANDYGLECYAAFSGCSTETEPSFAAVSELIEHVNEEKVPTIFYLEFSSQSVAQKIAESCGVKTDLLHSCHNISSDDQKNGVTFVDLMNQNYEKLSEALN